LLNILERTTHTCTAARDVNKAGSFKAKAKNLKAKAKAKARDQG